jgi:hypothetical protein
MSACKTDEIIWYITPATKSSVVYTSCQVLTMLCNLEGYDGISHLERIAWATCREDERWSELALDCVRWLVLNLMVLLAECWSAGHEVT